MRSQDKSSIVKIDNLYISVGNYICYYVEKGKEVPNTYYRPSGELGRYKTKERALEVLDEIQDILKPKILIRMGGNVNAINAFMNNDKNNFIQCYDNGTVKNINGTFVYEMPEE